MTGEVVGQSRGGWPDGSRRLDERALSGIRREAAIEVMSRHEQTLRRTARRYSICADDAEDAYQRALEILLTKAPPIEGDSLIRWMQTVTKREALGVRRQRVRLIGSPPSGVDDPDSHDPFELIASEVPGPDEKAARSERVRRSSEALRALKPQEVRALILKAEGYSYREIQEITGWTYTKVNRCMAEGRKRFLGVFSEIESGARCGQWQDDLSRLADGEVDGEDLIEVRIHLRTCAICRSQLREYRRVPGRVFGIGLPLPLLGAIDRLDSATASILERLKALSSALSRSTESLGDRVLTLSSMGGTRGTGTVALAKLLAVCGMAAAGSAACAISGLEPDPASGEPTPAKPAVVSTPVAPLDPKPVEPATSLEQKEQPIAPTDPVDQSTEQFSFEAAAAPPASSSIQPAVERPRPVQPQFGFEE